MGLGRLITVVDECNDVRYRSQGLRTLAICHGKQHVVCSANDC